MIETFTNEYGENWWFEYDKENDIGILKGDDFLIKEMTFYVFDGICPKLILNDEEQSWLKDCWDKYSKNKTNAYDVQRR